MNPLTIVKRIQSLNSKEASLGISEEASWHAKYKDSAYVFAGGIPFDLTEGDLLAVFSQYGEIVDVNLVRDKGTGKSKGFAFIAYEDQRSTTLAVDNLNGAQILGRTIRVDHVSNYKKKEEEDEETERQKREARGVCRAFQKGECNRGAGCKFSHDEQRAANTGWGQPEDRDYKKKGEEDEETERQKREGRGVCFAFQKGECTRGAGCKFSHDEQRAANTGWGQPEDRNSRWGHDKFDGPKKNEKRSGNMPLDRLPQPMVQEAFRSGDRDSSSRAKGNGRALDSHPKQSDRREEKKSRRHDDNKIESKSRDHDRGEERRSVQHNDDELERKSEDRYRREEKRQKRHNDEIEPRSGEDNYWRDEKISRRYGDEEFEPRSREDYDRREEKRSRRHDSESYLREDRDKRGDKRSAHNRDSSSQRQRDR